VDYTASNERKLILTFTDREALALWKELPQPTDLLESQPGPIEELAEVLLDFCRGFFDEPPALEPIWPEGGPDGDVDYRENV